MHRSLMVLLTAAFLTIGCMAPRAGERARENLTAADRAFARIERQHSLLMPPLLRVKAPAKAPVIDGKFDEVYLQQAEALTLAFLDGTAGIPDEATTAWLVADRQALYIMVRCAKDEPERVIAKRRTRDDKVWTDEVVELFLDPTGKGGDNYFHIIVNAAGVTQDARNKSDQSWNPALEVKCATEAGRAWTMEMRLPFAELGLPQDAVAGVWRMNICRNALDPDDPDATEESAWSPTGSGSFHNPVRFGRMVIDAFNAPEKTRARRMTTEKRRVWVWSDSWFGQNKNGRDGSEWARRAHTELRKNVGRPDYSVVLGDMTDTAVRSEMMDLVRFRNETGFPWFEIAGNHDYPALETGLYQELIRPERNYVVLDGNLVWILISAQRRASFGVLSASTRRWLLRTLKRHEDKNIIVGTHQIPPGTIRTSNKRDYNLAPKKWITELFTKVRIDAWLCAHDPEHPRSLDQMKTIAWPPKNGKARRTTFINVSTLNHANRTQASNSVVLDLKSGEKSIRARVRDHDNARYLPGHEITIPLPYPLELGGEPEVIDELSYDIVSKRSEP